MKAIGKLEAGAEPAGSATTIALVVNAPAHDFQGHFDTCGPSYITGWAYDRANATVPCEVEVRIDGVPSGRAVANRFRQDLLELGHAAGSCAFRILLPEVLFDDQEHVVEVREASTGFSLMSSPRKVRLDAAARGDIRFHHGALKGTIRTRQGFAEPADLQVVDLDSGDKIATGKAEADAADVNLLRFDIALPTSAFDGRAHVFSVRAKDKPVLLHDIAVMMPSSSTPEESLLRYARNGMTASQSAAANFRYESLTRAIDSLLKDGPAPGLTRDKQLEQLMRVHAQLVSGFSDKDRSFAPLAFPQWEKPVASIVIPAHNKFQVTYHCLCSLLLAPNKATFEVILVDDGSQDKTTEVPDIVSGIQYVRNDSAQGFIRSSNAGAQGANGQFIVMLNNDTEVTAGWLDELLWAFEHFDGVGLAGAKLIYPDGRLQEAGGIVWGSGNPWNYGRDANAKDPRYNYARQVDYVSGACLMLRSEVWKELGGFDEEFLPAYFEDTDLSFRVRARGLKTVYVPTAQVIHFEGMSSGTSVVAGTKRFQEVNRPKFKTRWSASCRDNGKEGVNVDLEKDRNVRGRALIIDALTPMPDKDAGSHSAVQEMRMLQALGFKCTFAPDNLAWMGEYTASLQRMGVEAVHAPYFSSVKHLLEQRGSEFDLVYIMRYYVAQRHIDLIRQFAPRAKIVFMNVDLHFLREMRYALQTGAPEDMRKSHLTRDEELAVMRKVDLVLTYTDVEKAVIFSHTSGAAKVEKCPWTVEVASDVPGFEGRKDIAFLGGFDHHPNSQAVRWFVAEVMPLLRKRLPGVNLRVYGSNMPEDIVSLLAKHEDTIAEGWVPSVRDAYDRCRVFVAPLRSGAGIKGKVIGALGCGVPTVMSPVAAEGIGVVNGVEAWVADTPEEWVSSIAKAYETRELWDSVSTAARVMAARKFGFRQAVAEMRMALRSADLYTEPDDKALAAH